MSLAEVGGKLWRWHQHLVQRLVLSHGVASEVVFHGSAGTGRAWATLSTQGPWRSQ